MQAGLSTMNTSVIQTKLFNNTATEVFWWSYPSILTDGQQSKSVKPLTGEMAYFLPGPVSSIITKTNITQSDFPAETALIQNDSPGYQIDFAPITKDDPPITLDDCRVFGVNQIAFQVCLKNSNATLLAGISTRDLTDQLGMHVQCKTFKQQPV